MIRMHCLTYRCEQSVGSCVARHRRSLRQLDQGRMETGPSIDCAEECGGCGTGRAAAEGTAPAWRRSHYKAKEFPYLDGVATIRQLARLARCEIKAMESRLRRGTSTEDAVAMGPAVEQRGADLYPYKGGEITIKDAARMAGLRTETVRGRIKRGMTMDQAMTAPLRAGPLYTVRKARRSA